MKYQLRQGLHFCECGDRTIFLDLPADRYFCLSDADEQLFRSTIGGHMIGEPEVARLMRLDLLEERSAGVAVIPQNARILPHDGRAEDAVSGSAPIFAIARAAIALLRAELSIRLRSLDGILDRYHRRKAGIRPRASTGAVLDETIQAFASLARWISPRDRCLPRSIAMGHLLLSRGIPADIVLGVVSRPFRAHCWVEYQGALLSDRLENVRTYTPIMAV